MPKQQMHIIHTRIILEKYGVCLKYSVDFLVHTLNMEYGTIHIGNILIFILFYKLFINFYILLTLISLKYEIVVHYIYVHEYFNWEYSM